jgi:hypothetical protein
MNEGKELKEGTSTIKWAKPNSFVLFQKKKTWNWKLKWHATIAQNLWFNHIFDLTIYFYNKSYFLWILQPISMFIQDLMERKL